MYTPNHALNIINARQVLMVQSTINGRLLATFNTISTANSKIFNQFLICIFAIKK